MEKIQVDNAVVKQFRSLLQNGNVAELELQLSQMYAQDIALLIDRLPAADSREILNLLNKDKVIKVLVEMEESARAHFLSAYTPYEIANNFIEHMDSDDAAYLLNHLPNKIKEDVIGQLQDIEYASSLLSLTNYEEYTAGSLMALELVKVSINQTVAECIEEIRRQNENVDNIYVVYVVDDLGRLMGIITLKNLLLAKPNLLVSEVYNSEVIAVNTSADSEVVANLTKKYDLVVLPVVDVLGRLVGRITIDDVVDVIKEEADEDYQLMSGITSDVAPTDSIFDLSKARLPWLIIGLFGGIVSSRFLGVYESEIQIHPEMAFFIPLIAAMGGNVGVQSSAIVVQGLANDTLGTKNIGQKILKELRLALFNGLICAIIILAYNLIFNDSLELALTVAIALITVIIFASVFGTFIPMVLNKVKIDPAIATGPFITTSNDLLGIVIYFSIGRLMYQTF
jgi:magnesium transporter